MKIQREIYMFKLYNNYGKLLYKNIELWFVRKKIEYNNGNTIHKEEIQKKT